MDAWQKITRSTGIASFAQLIASEFSLNLHYSFVCHLMHEMGTLHETYTCSIYYFIFVLCVILVFIVSLACLHRWKNPQRLYFNNLIKPADMINLSKFGLGMKIFWSQWYMSENWLFRHLIQILDCVYLYSSICFKEVALGRPELKVVQGPSAMHAMQPWRWRIKQQNRDASKVNLSELQIFFSSHFSYCHLWQLYCLQK